jgi:hypothetical protein
LRDVIFLRSAWRAITSSSRLTPETVAARLRPCDRDLYCSDVSELSARAALMPAITRAG